MKKEEAGTGVTKMQTLANIILFGMDNEQIPAEAQTLCDEAGVKLWKLAEVVQKGVEHRSSGSAEAPDLPNRDHVYMLSYTSGTTGDPKGV